MSRTWRTRCFVLLLLCVTAGEQVHAALAVDLAYRKEIMLSLRPTLLANTDGLLVRLPLVLKIPLYRKSAALRGREIPLVLWGAGAAGAGTWNWGTQAGLLPFLSAGMELSVGALSLCAFVTTILQTESVDLLTELYLGYLWDL